MVVAQRTPRLLFRILLLVSIALAIPARADWVAGVTTDIDTSGIGAVVEHHWQDFGAIGALSGNIAIAGRIDADGDGWVGAGVAGRYRFGGKFFVEGSFMPGLYRTGDTDLGGSLQFRSLIGAGYELNEDIAVSITIDHLSNGSTQTDNPGSDAVMLRFTFR